METQSKIYIVRYKPTNSTPLVLCREFHDINKAKLFALKCIKINPKQTVLIENVAVLDPSCIFYDIKYYTYKTFLELRGEE